MLGEKRAGKRQNNKPHGSIRFMTSPKRGERNTFSPVSFPNRHFKSISLENARSFFSPQKHFELLRCLRLL
jgi:hypothetical protein